MNKIAFCAALVAIWLGHTNEVFAAQEISETANAHLTMTLSGPSTVVAGNEIELGITLTNATGAIVDWSRARTNRGDDARIDFDVRGLGGVQPPLTSYGKALHGDKTDITEAMNALSVSGELIKSNTGETTQETSAISDIYNMGTPGTYVIKAKRCLADGSVITSNEIKITVVK